ncbi:MAG: TIGR02147 family protein [Fibrobacteria bacterium]
MPDLFTYHDYRRFLRDYYTDRKARDPKFSHRFLARKLGYGSSGAFADILSGRKNLTSSSALRLARGISLGKSEEEFFLHLVAFNQAGSLEEKNLHYAKILSMARMKLDIISPQKHEYYGKWYYAAVRELLFFHSCKDDYKALGRKLNPPIPAKDAKRAVELLERLGMIARNGEGTYRQTAPLLSTGGFGSSLHVENFQKATMELAIEALDRHPREVRDISTLTVTLSEKSMEQARTALKAVRHCILGLAEKDEKVDRVYQLNIQLFPLTET